MSACGGARSWYPPGPHSARRPSGRGDQVTDALDVLRASYKKVMTVPFLPICQGSRGKKRTIIRSWPSCSSFVRNSKKRELWPRFSSAVPTTPMEETISCAPGSAEPFTAMGRPGRIVTLTRSSGLPRMAAVAAQSRFSSPAGTRPAGKFVSSSTNGMSGGKGRELPRRRKTLRRPRSVPSTPNWKAGAGRHGNRAPHWLCGHTAPPDWLPRPHRLPQLHRLGGLGADFRKSDCPAAQD